MIDIKELFWVAGFIEGEGSVHCNPKKSLLSISANQKVRQPLDRLQKTMGGSIRLAERQYKDGPHFMFEWQLVGTQAAGACMTLYGLLSDRRRAQIRLALGRWKSHRAHHRHWTHCKRGHEFTVENTYVQGKTRRCRICVRESHRVGHLRRIA